MDHEADKVMETFVPVSVCEPEPGRAFRRMRAKAQLSPMLPAPFPAASLAGWSSVNGSPVSVPRRFHTSLVA